jgi:hypothetical protein
MKTRRQNYTNYHESKDRLSDLPDCCVLLYILSTYLDSKKSVQTCILSKRWKNLWRRLPVLSIDSFEFTTVEGFTKFTSQFLSLRDASTALHVLSFCNYKVVEPLMLEKILKKAVSNDVQRIYFYCDHIEKFPTNSFSCHTLKSLCFSFYPGNCNNRQFVLFPSSLNLPSLIHRHSLCLDSLLGS